MPLLLAEVGGGVCKSWTSDVSLGLGESSGGGCGESVALVSGPLLFSALTVDSTTDGPVASSSCPLFPVIPIGEESGRICVLNTLLVVSYST